MERNPLLGTLLGALMVSTALVAGHTQPPLPAGDADSILTPVTREWQTKAIPRLRAFRPDVTTAILEVEDQGQGRLLIPYAPEGILWLGGEEWVYLTSFWSHTADPQVILVIDREGRIYRNFEHICPSLFLRSPDGAALDSLEAFLKTETDPGDGPPRWELLDDSAATPERQALPTAREHQVAVALAEEATPEARKAAVRALIREGSDESWAVVEEVLEGSTDWGLLEAARRAVGNASPVRAESVRRLLSSALGNTPAQRANRLAEAIVRAEDRESLDYLLPLMDGGDADALCAAFEGIAAARDEQAHRQLGGFPALRNSLVAFAALDRDRAVGFCHSLLDSRDACPQQAGIYAAGELRLADTVEKLVTLVDRDRENYFVPDCVSIALGKIGTPEAHEALIALLLREPIHVKQSWAVLCVMTEVCGEVGGSPRGSWSNGCWATVAEDKTAAAERFAEAMNELAERTTDERLAREARGRASSIVSRTR